MPQASPGPDLPSGTVTFLFTDIEGSTRLLQELGDAWTPVVDWHHAILRGTIERAGGVVVRTEGDAFFAVFPNAPAAVAAAVEAQREIAASSWPAPLRVRMGLHTGEGTLGAGEYVGLGVHLAARVAATGHGGQVVLSSATRGLVEHALPEGVRLRDLGPHRLKDIPDPARLHDLVVEGLPSDFPSLRTAESHPHNLPTPLTSFVGRERELEELHALIGRQRLITLVGPGGTGKTRLALEAAHAALPRFEEGAWFIDLAPLRDPALVPSAAVGALGLAEEPQHTPEETLRRHLAERRALVVFDNFEHVLEASGVLEGLLGAAPQACLVVTSREPLRLYGERVYSVPPLEVPDDADGLAFGTLCAFEAVDLFARRARAVRSDFELSPETAPLVARICAALDGLPLAIELAASRINLLSPEEIAARLDDRLSLLRHGARNVPERQRTLRAAIAWSYELLDEPERRLLRKLSVFAGGATLEAIERVVGDGVDVLETLGSLVDKSLVRRREARGGEARFAMLETVREFAAEELAQRGEAEAAGRRHLGWVEGLALETEAELTGMRAGEVLDRWEREHANLRAALRFAIDRGEGAAALRIGAAVWRFWHQRGHLRQGRAWLEEALGLPGPRDATRMRAHNAAGGLAYWLVDADGTREHYERAAEIARELGDERSEMEAIHNLSYVPVLLGDDAGAQPFLEQALEIATRLHDERTIARLTIDLGWVDLVLDRLAEATGRFELAIEMSRRLGNAWDLLDAYGALGLAQRLLGDLDGARASWRQNRDLMRAAGNRTVASMLLESLAGLASDEERHDAAVRLVGAARAAREALGGGAPPHAARIDEVVPRARASLGDRAVETLLGEGAGMQVDEALSLVDEELARGT